MSKLFSGRYILTVICGFVFAYVAMNNIIPTEAIVSILVMVFVAYFQRDRSTDRNQPDTNGGTK
jgi:Flp pilus assembly protein TadB